MYNVQIALRVSSHNPESQIRGLQSVIKSVQTILNDTDSVVALWLCDVIESVRHGLLSPGTGGIYQRYLPTATSHRVTESLPAKLMTVTLI